MINLHLLLNTILYYMAKMLTIKNLTENCNTAINLKKSELLKDNKDLKKDEVVVSIIEEWKTIKYGNDNKINVNICSDIAHKVEIRKAKN